MFQISTLDWLDEAWWSEVDSMIDRASAFTTISFLKTFCDVRLTFVLWRKSEEEWMNIWNLSIKYLIYIYVPISRLHPFNIRKLSGERSLSDFLRIGSNERHRIWLCLGHRRHEISFGLLIFRHSVELELVSGLGWNDDAISLARTAFLNELFSTATSPRAILSFELPCGFPTSTFAPKYSTPSWREKNPSLTKMNDLSWNIQQKKHWRLSRVRVRPLSDRCFLTLSGRPQSGFHVFRVELPVAEIGSNGITDESNSPWNFNSSKWWTLKCHGFDPI
jgi:hypothetical protein